MFNNRLFNPLVNIRLHRFSKRELLSLTMLTVSIGALTLFLWGGGVLLVSLFNGLQRLLDIGIGAFVIGVAYLVGFLTALVAIRVYGNLTLPIIIHLYTWVYLFAVCGMYILIIQRLYMRSMYIRSFDNPHYWISLMIVALGLGTVVGLHLVIEDHDLRPFSIPLLITNLFQLGLIVYRYAFSGPNKDFDFLWQDLLLFFSMMAASFLMMANLSILAPVGTQITSLFDRIARLMGLMSNKP